MPTLGRGEKPTMAKINELEVPCVQGEMGGVKYYLISLPLGEVATRLVYQEEHEGENLPLEERYQRKLNEARVQQSLVPYLEKKDHFFPPVVATVDDEKIRCKDDLLVLPENVVFPVLDGQHRLAAVRDYLDRDLPPSRKRDVQAETIGVVLLEGLPLEKRQQMFSDLNRNQKVPPKALGILFDQRDVCAVVAKQLAHRPMFKDKVNMESSAISKKTQHIVTLGMLYEIARTFMLVVPSAKVAELKDEFKKATAEEAADEIGEVLEKVVFAAMPDHENVGKVSPEAVKARATYLCYSSLGWYAISRAVARLLGFGMSGKEIRQRLGEIDWRITNPMWEHVVPGGKVMVRRDTIEFAAALIERRITGASRSRTIRRRGGEEHEVSHEA